MLEKARQEVTPSLNQYGGEPGASSTHLLVEAIDKVTSHLEDNRAAAVLSSLDFSKVFNRLAHKQCLEAFSRKGASTDTIEILASFLMGRRMTVRNEGSFSSLRNVNAGVPLGSVLGCYLFNAGIDDLEAEFKDGSTEDNEQYDYINRVDDYPAMSTPIRVRSDSQSVGESPIQGLSHFGLVPRVANVPPWVLKTKDVRWVEEELKSLKYVDDSINIEKFNLRAVPMLQEEGTFIKITQPHRTKMLLEHVTRRANEKGMLVNNPKPH